LGNLYASKWKGSFPNLCVLNRLQSLRFEQTAKGLQMCMKIRNSADDFSGRTDQIQSGRRMASMFSMVGQIPQEVKWKTWLSVGWAAPFHTSTNEMSL
jgi:hypothetical protein